jgi:serine phosphatase RsbU (regulator of sigma subunit)
MFNSHIGGAKRIMNTNPSLYHYFTRKLLLFVLLSCYVTSAMAHGPRYTHIATSAKILEDKDHQWTPEDVAYGKIDSLFKDITENTPNLNFTTSTYWVTFQITNGTELDKSYYIETARALTNSIELYEVTPIAIKKLYKTGDELPFDKRPVIYRKFIFPITLKPLESKQLIFRVTSDGEVVSMPIKLWHPENFHGFVQRENLTLGIYYGLLMLVTGLFLFFAFVVKQRIYSYYVLYVAFLFFMQASLDGLAFEYLWPNWPWMANHSILIFSGASVFTLMLYAAEFLTLSAKPKWFKTFYKSLMGFVLICIITGATSGFAYEITYPIINGLSLISLVIIFMAIGWVYKSKRKLSPFFTLGFLAVLTGGILFILTNFNLLESDFLSHNAIKMGSAGEVIFLSLAMVSRYRDIQREKDEAKKQAFENLEMLNKVTQEQNEILEIQVKERTAEIRQKSEELEEKNKEIIDSITYAKRIQEAILPPDTQVRELLPNAFIYYQPKDIVAGDFYWMEDTEDYLFLAAADCTGHGVPGAMVSVVCHNALNRSVREFGLHEPGKILDQTAIIVDETFEKSEQEVKDGMDISLCAIHKATKKVSWTGANNPIWVISKKTIESIGEPSLSENEYHLYEIKADKQPIGRYPNREAYHTHHIELNPMDTIYLFSDGYPDQFGGERGKKYKSKNFKRFLLGIQDQTITDQSDLLRDEFETWRGDLEQIDDVCVIGVRF